MTVSAVGYCMYGRRSVTGVGSVVRLFTWKKITSFKLHFKQFLTSLLPHQFSRVEYRKIKILIVFFLSFYDLFLVNAKKNLKKMERESGVFLCF